MRIDQYQTLISEIKATKGSKEEELKVINRKIAEREKQKKCILPMGNLCSSQLSV